MVLDGITVLGSAVLATLYQFRTGPLAGARGFWHGTLIHGWSMSILLALLCGFTFTLIITSRRMHLYSPLRLTSFLDEQRLSVQACLTSGLLLTGTLYLIRAEAISRTVVLVTLGMVTIALSLRRLIYRIMIYKNFERGVGTRNVLIVGTGPEAHALRHHLENMRHLGYTFVGFIDSPESGTGFSASSSDVVGSLKTMFQYARKQFVDEIFFTAPCDRALVQDVVEEARVRGVDLRIVPDMYGGLLWTTPIEYIGQFPTIPLHRGHVPVTALLLKRFLDILFSALALIILFPVLVAIAIAVKLDSPGSAFYTSERIGKKGVVFRCIKFRTMVRDAESRRSEVVHLNERDGTLFKISKDPRITKVGSFLRKYSLDELPQFFNVLSGDMSLVGPRPPIASEVKEYKLSHLRRLDVTPGITGLWQVQARQDPSFDRYISLDVAYIENWSIWLDLKIIMLTIGVVFAGTGS
jgi:exopolysaccharide biosynthesis polyprenyl glycosylphosphotransferase